MKQCSKCNEVMSYDFFSKAKSNKDGYTGQCKSCVKQYYKQYGKQYRQENKNKIKKYYKEYYKEYHKQYYQENKERVKQYQQEKKDIIKQYNKQYYQENKEQKKQYQQENRQKINEYFKNRRIENPLFKLSTNLRNRTSKAFKNKGYSKNTKTQEMLGVDFEIVKVHIERQFKNGMNWDNYGEWHIDHIIPLASANTEEELFNLCRYTNLQPLWAEDNLSKGCKIYETQLKIL
jgi:hypothetical protein